MTHTLSGVIRQAISDLALLIHICVVFGILLLSEKILLHDALHFFYAIKNISPVTTNGREHGTTAPFITSSQVPLKKLLFELNCGPNQVNRKQYGSSICCSTLKKILTSNQLFICTYLRALVAAITNKITQNSSILFIFDTSNIIEEYFMTGILNFC